MKILTSDNIPCWYELSWREDGPSIVLRVHQEFIDNSQKIPDNAPIAELFRDDFKFKQFCGNFEKNFGFDNALRRLPARDEFVEFSIDIPHMKKRTEEKCPDCNGTGKDEFLLRECFHCDGSGKETFLEWGQIYAISASLTVFFTFSQFPIEETSSQLHQLFTIKTVADKDMHGGSLWGEFSIPFTDWLISLGQVDLPEVVHAMQVTHKQLFGQLKEFDKYSFRACLRESGSIIIDCPGNACGIHPEINTRWEGFGYKFTCHNVDTPWQQLTLLTALAVLHDRAREEIKA